MLHPKPPEFRDPRGQKSGKGEGEGRNTGPGGAKGYGPTAQRVSTDSRSLEASEDPDSLLGWLAEAWSGAWPPVRELEMPRCLH